MLKKEDETYLRHFKTNEKIPYQYSTVLSVQNSKEISNIFFEEKKSFLKL